MSENCTTIRIDYDRFDPPKNRISHKNPNISKIHKDRDCAMAYAYIAWAHEAEERGDVKEAAKYYNLALDERTLDDMNERLGIAQSLMELRPKVNGR